MDIWVLASGKTISADFSFSTNDTVYLEQADGNLVAVPLNRFQKTDRSRLMDRMAAIERMNGATPTSAPVKWKQRIPSVPTLILLTLVLLFAIHLLPSRDLGHILSIPLSLKPLAAASVLLLFVLACSKKEAMPPSGGVTTPVIPKTRTSFLDSAFQLFKPGISTSSDANYYYVSGNGMPDHGMMVGITSWQQQVPIPQAYTGANSWSIPLQPSYATTPMSTKSNFMKGAVAIAINGIPIFNALNNRGEDSYAIGELDNWGGHCGRADDYHYHAAPLHLNQTVARIPIAFALDGFAVYGTKEPDGNGMNALDTCHGHVGGEGVYHYHGTSTYPYVIGAMRGKVTTDPATPAPENQILPQAFAKAARPALTVLRGAAISDFKSTGPTSYSLTYRIGIKSGYVNYGWDANNRYTYTHIDTAGVSTTSTYQR